MPSNRDATVSDSMRGLPFGVPADYSPILFATHRVPAINATRISASHKPVMWAARFVSV